MLTRAEIKNAIKDNEQEIKTAIESGNYLITFERFCNLITHRDLLKSTLIEMDEKELNNLLNKVS